MKTVSFLLFICFSMNVLAQQLPHATSYVDKYPDHADHALYIPGTFSQEKLLSSYSDQLAGKTIKRIDLVYTRFKASASFNQKALNEARMKQFNQFYPGIASQVKEINWVEQTGADTRSEAAEYFHGFVVFYEDPAPVQQKETVTVNLREYFSDPGNEGTRFSINNNRDTTIYFESGTSLKIAAHSVATSDNNAVYGSYTIVYKEYRNPAEIALSGIPMTFQKNGQEFLFNSAGMLEVRGYQHDKELKLIKPLTIDFNCTETLPDLSYYQLDDRTNRWKELRKINWDQAKVAGPTKRKQATRKKNKKKKTPERRNFDRGNGTLHFGFFYRLFHRKEFKNGGKKKNVHREFANLNNGDATLLAEGTNTGHTYPTQVRGLNCPEFGVYNCDQIFRVGTPVAIQPTYLDKSSGEAIQKPFVACLIDRDVNGSFSFDPSMIQCNPASKNIILLFTEDEKVYALDSDEFAQLNLDNPQVKLAMKEITNEAKTSDDLKKYLNL